MLNASALGNVNDLSTFRPDRAIRQLDGRTNRSVRSPRRPSRLNPRTVVDRRTNADRRPKTEKLNPIVKLDRLKIDRFKYSPGPISKEC